MMVPGRELMSSLASARGRVPADVGPAGPEQTPPPVHPARPGPGRVSVPGTRVCMQQELKEHPEMQCSQAQCSRLRIFFHFFW